MNLDDYYKQVRERLEQASNPLFIFDDDTDGLSAFLLLYRFVKNGNYYLLKTTPDIGPALIPNLKRYNADLIVILDVAIVRQEFIDQVHIPVVWVDHHDVQQVERVLYLNPHFFDQNIPTSALCYEVVKQDMWIGMIGSIGDWHFPSFGDDFIAQYPRLLEEKMKPEEVQHKSLFGRLIRIFSFNLRGKSDEVQKAIHILMQIKSPYEIIDKSSPEGIFLYNRFEMVNKEFDSLLAQALCHKEENPLIFLYEEAQISLTADVANELQYLFPEKCILVGRVRGGEAKCSLRYTKGNLPMLVMQALQGLRGTGGGHDVAVGAVINEQDFPLFLDRLKQEL